MRNDLLSYIDFLRKDDSFLFENYPKFCLLYDSFIKSDKVSLLFSDVDDVLFKDYNFINCSPDTVFSYVADFLSCISPDMFFEFNENVVSGKLVYSDSIKKSQFLAIRDKDSLSLGEYSIDISKTSTIKDCFSMIHEFTHYLINRINMNNNLPKGLINIYDESLAIYNELLFYNYIKFKNLNSDVDYIFKKRIYDDFSQGAILHDYYDAICMICDGKSVDEVRFLFNDDNSFSEFRDLIKNKQKSEYVHFVGTLNALNLFFNKVDICKLIDCFNNNDFSTFSCYVYPDFDVNELVFRLSLFMEQISNAKNDIK